MEPIISIFFDMSMPRLSLPRRAPARLDCPSPRPRAGFSRLSTKPRARRGHPRGMETATAMQLPERTADTRNDEVSLAARARDGDVKAFEQLYRRYVGRVHAVCLRLAGNPTLAEECTQDAFVKAWES